MSTGYSGNVYGNVYGSAGGGGPGPTPAPQTTLYAWITLNGEPVEGAELIAQLTAGDSVAGGETIPSTQRDRALSDVGGYVELILYRQVAFTLGDGRYAIEVKHCGKVIASVVAPMPDQDQVNLADLLSAAAAGYNFNPGEPA